MKSALEIAMERANKLNDGSESKLTDEQKKTIAEIRREYSGKNAEREIMLQNDLKKMEGNPSQDVQSLIQLKKEEFVREKKKLSEELEGKIQKIRMANTKA